MAVTDDPALRVRADLLRELHGDLDPRGVRIAGVRVVGHLDLDHVTAVTGLDLFQCAVPDGITCRHARLRHLYLRASLLTYLYADELRTDSSLFLHDVTVTGVQESGAIRLLSAQIGGALQLDRATITNATGPGLRMR